MAQSGANCSPMSNFPDQLGKYREFLRFQARSHGLRCEKARTRLSFFAKFPTQPNRELFRRNRELNLPIREFTRPIREITNSPYTAPASPVLQADQVCRLDSPLARSDDGIGASLRTGVLPKNYPRVGKPGGVCRMLAPPSLRRLPYPWQGPTIITLVPEQRAARGFSPSRGQRVVGGSSRRSPSATR
jgi:hypothetical protein